MRPVGAACGALPAYERALDGDDADAAVALVQEMLDAGFEPIAVLTDVVAAAQRGVGARWQRGEWTVAQEHAATAIAVASTRAVAEHVRRTPPTRGRVLVACAEREWHALPAMMIDCVLRANGWDSSLLGAATSPLRMNQYLQDLGPEAVAVSCSVLGAIPATRRIIEASTASGVPILVGGPAFGVDDIRAAALGARHGRPTPRARWRRWIGCPPSSHPPRRCLPTPWPSRPRSNWTISASSACCGSAGR
jgi:MerR family transcriptional regulator, light-induced transcriptional regulator